MTMRILFVNHSAELDGATQVLVNLIGSLDSEKIEPLVLLPREGPITERFERANVPYRIISVGHCRWDEYHIPLLKMLLSEGKYDVVHANTLESFPAVITAKLCGIPSVWHTHELMSHVQHYNFKRVDDRLFAEAVRSSTLICAVSEATKKAFVEYCSERKIDSGEKIRVIHNGVEARSASRTHASPARSITAIGNIIRQKGIEYLIEAFADLAKEHPETTLNIIGKVFPGDFIYFYNLVEKLEVGGTVRFHTEVADIDKVYAESDIFVCPSLVESLPMVLLEAMSHAIPVVATEVGGVGELIEHGQTGVLVPPGDAGALAAAIGSCLDNWDNTIEMGERGRKSVAESFSLEKQAREFMSAYEDLAGSAEGPPTDSWDVEALRKIILEHLTSESEKIHRLERHGEDMLTQQRFYLENGILQHEGRLSGLEERMNHQESATSDLPRERANIIRDLRAVENLVENLLNQWPFRIMRKIKAIIRRS